MLIKDVYLTSEEIKKIVAKYNAEYNEYISRKNVLLRAINRCENKSNETLI